MFKIHRLIKLSFFFFFNDAATTEIYTLSLHDALPIYRVTMWSSSAPTTPPTWKHPVDRKSTRLNSSHVENSYAVFCLKTKKKKLNHSPETMNAAPSATMIPHSAVG